MLRVNSVLIVALSVVPTAGSPPRDRDGKRWALVTGASSGIGLELAKRAAECGWNVMLSGRSRERLEAAAKEMKDVETAILVADLASPKGAEKLHRAATKLAATKLGTVDVLLANAGIATVSPFHDQNIDDIDAMISVNVRSTILLARLFCDARIILTSSIAGLSAHGVRNAAVYGATKALLRSFGNALRSEGLDVLVLLPGAVDTNFARASGMTDAFVFTLGRHLGLVSSPRSVARRIDLRRRSQPRELVPGPMNSAFALAAKYLPSAVTRSIAGLSFSQKKRS